MVEKFPEEVLENLTGNEFPEMEPFNRKISVNSEEELSKMELKRFREENVGIHDKVVPFSVNSGKCCSIRHWKFTEMQTEIFSPIGSGQYIQGETICVRYIADFM